MATFDQLKQWIENSDITNIRRTREGDEEYKQYLTLVNEQWNSIDDYILFRVFNMPFENDVNTGKRKVSYNSSHLRKINAVMMKNDFPYNIDPSVQHFVLWSTQRLRVDQVPSVINRVLPKAKYDVTWFENPSSMKSVKQVWHVQVFTKTKNRQCALM